MCSEGKIRSKFKEVHLKYFLQVMMVEETVWEDHETCDHSYDKRCHKSYTTTYTAVQVMMQTIKYF